MRPGCSRLIVAALLLGCGPVGGPAVAEQAEPEDALFEHFEQLERAREVNTGPLRFLDSAPARQVHHHSSHMRITDQSLLSGWVRLDQCHHNLDAVALSQILYREGHIRGLQIVSSHAIGSARVEGHSVQLEDVGPGAHICVTAESLVLSRDEDGDLLIRNGPFMRRFLDGYYPMRVSLRYEFPAGRLAVRDIEPAAQAGMQVEIGEGRVEVEALFEGMLFTLLRLCERGRAGCP